jgi:hypothetical protein
MGLRAFEFRKKSLVTMCNMFHAKYAKEIRKNPQNQDSAVLACFVLRSSLREPDFMSRLTKNKIDTSLSL